MIKKGFLLIFTLINLVKTYINLDLYIDKFNNEIFRAYYSPIELSKKIFVKDYNNTLKPFIEKIGII